MTKYCRSTDVVPNPEFMDNFDNLKSIKQLYLSVVTTSSPMDKIFDDLGPMDNRKYVLFFDCRFVDSFVR